MKILNFRNTSILFLLLLSVFTIFLIVIYACYQPRISLFYRLSWSFYLFLISLYLGISVVMAFFPSSGFHYPDVITRGSRINERIALSFDDGPDAELTPLILDILEKHKVQAVFFIIGKKIRGNENILKRIVNDGHIIGNHSWAHTNLWDFYSSKRMAADIEKNISETENLTGKKMKLFRPPFGVINPMVAKAIRKTRVKVITWSFRSFDTTSSDTAELLKKTVTKVKPGDILLFHDTSGTTAGFLEKLIVTLQQRKYRFVPLDELINTQAYE